MTTTESPLRLHELDREECLHLLATAAVGRIAAIQDGYVHIVPVNIVLDGDAILFWSAVGSTLPAATGASMTVEVDHVDTATRTGWSVVARGLAQRIPRVDEPDVVARLGLVSWAPGDPPNVFRVVATDLTGWLIASHPPSGCSVHLAPGMGGRPAAADTPIIGIHHADLPVTDLEESAEWFAQLGFRRLVAFESEDAVVALVLRHPCGAQLKLHLDPRRAASLAGFDPLTVVVADYRSLQAQVDRCRADGMEVSGIFPAHLGWAARLVSPDGAGIRLHTAEPLDEADD